MLFRNSLYAQTEDLSRDDFHSEPHRQIYSQITALLEDGLAVDETTLTTALEGSGQLENCGGFGYIASLDGGCIPENISSYVRQIKQASHRRQIIRQYGEIEKCIATPSPNWLATLTDKAAEFHQLLNNSNTGKQSSELIVVHGSEISEKPLRFIWKPYLPSGKLVHFGGNSSQAKSPVTIDLAARISTGQPWPDGTPNEQGPRSVILLNIEDDLEDTIAPRFRLAGGDKNKLYYVRGTRIRVNDTFVERGLTLENDMQKLTQLAHNIPDIGLVVIDPITNYLGNAKMNAEEQVRALLTPLANLARELGITVITVGHFNRREKGTDPLHRNMGAAAFHGVARAVYAFGPDPDEDSKYCHVMSVSRGCGGDGASLRYRTELTTESGVNGAPNEIVRVVWTGTSDATSQDVIDSASTQDKTRENEAALILKSLLQDGRKSAKECTDSLKAEGYDPDTLNAGRIRRKAGAGTKRFAGDRFNSWYLLSQVDY
jgi:hypothetical protein